MGTAQGTKGAANGLAGPGGIACGCMAADTACGCVSADAVACGCVAADADAAAAPAPPFCRRTHRLRTEESDRPESSAAIFRHWAPRRLTPSAISRSSSSDQRTRSVKTSGPAVATP
eukprot:3374777-Prymnesium_polylepis.2